MARLRWDSEITSMAQEYQRDTPTEVPLSDASRLLPTETVADALKAACYDSATHEAGIRAEVGTALADGQSVSALPALPRDPDAPPGTITYVVQYRSADLDRRLNDAVIGALRGGILAASGFESRSAINAGRVDIPPDRWASLAPDFAKSVASGPGFVLTDVMVVRVDIAAERPAKGRVATKRVSISRIRACLDEARAEYARSGRPIPNVESLHSQCAAQLGCGRDAVRAADKGERPGKVRRGRPRKVA